MKKYLFIASVLLFIFLLAFYQDNNCYRLKIDLYMKNAAISEIDVNLSDEIKDKISQIPEIKDIVLFSRDDMLSVYCKINPFCLDKKFIQDKIEKKLKQALVAFDENIGVVFNEEYYLKYQTFLVVEDESDDYLALRNTCETVLDRLLGLKISAKILNLGKQQKIAYIDYKNSDLVKYNINLKDLKDIIDENNISKGSVIKTTKNSSYNINLNNDFKTTDDIKNVVIPYRNSRFAQKFENIFEIKEDIRHPSLGLVYFDNKKAQVLAISKKKFYPQILFDLKLAKFKKTLSDDGIKTTVLKTSGLNKIEIYLDDDANIYACNALYHKIISSMNSKNLLAFLGFNPPKTSNRVYFDEVEKNKIVLMFNSFDTQKIEAALKKENISYLKSSDLSFYIYDESLDNLYKRITAIKKNNPDAISSATNKTLQFDYKINNFLLNDYALSKEEVIDAILCANEGLYCAHFWSKGTKIPVVLRNNQQEIFIYSKKYQTLIPLNSVAKPDIISGFNVIARKNDKFFAKLTYQNPSLIRRVKLQIRCLLSLF